MSKVVYVRDDRVYRQNKFRYASRVMEDIRTGFRSQLPLCSDCNAEVDVSDIDNFEFEVQNIGHWTGVTGITCWFCCHDECEPLGISEEQYQAEVDEYLDAVNKGWMITYGVSDVDEA